jgi:hypothetical protein
MKIKKGTEGQRLKVSQNITIRLAKMSHDKFVLVISLVEVNRSLCHATQGVRGEEK